MITPEKTPVVYRLATIPSGLSEASWQKETGIVWQDHRNRTINGRRRSCIPKVWCRCG